MTTKTHNGKSAGKEIGTEAISIARLLKPVEAMLRENKQCGVLLKLTMADGGPEILKFKPAEQAALAGALVPRASQAQKELKESSGRGTKAWEKARKQYYGPLQVMLKIFDELLRKTLPFTQEQLHPFLQWVCSSPEDLSSHQFPLAGIVKAAENLAREGGFSKANEQLLARFAEKLRQADYAPEHRKFASALQRLLKSAPRAPLEAGEAWSDTALADLRKMNAKQQAAWNVFLGHCAAAAGPPPGKAWLKIAHDLLRQVREQEFKQRVLAWFPLVDKPRTQRIEGDFDYEPDPNLLITEANAEVLKGLAWCAGFKDDKEIATALTGLAISAFKKVPLLGARCLKLGNACLHALGAMPGTEAVGQFAILKARVKLGTAQKAIEKFLQAAAKRAGLPREELEEMSVPSYALTEVGRCVERMGGYTGELLVNGSGETELFWREEDGKVLASVPKVVKERFGEDLKELQTAAKDIQRMLPAQKERIDNLFREKRTWAYSVWRQRYLDHPLVGVLARRLIWEFTQGKRTAAGIFFNDKLVDLDLRPIAPLGEQTTVQLWHPLGKEVDDVLAWRAWLEDQEIRQPFKQAHREVYLLTEAERKTRTFSNRFAAHILRQHQFNALCAARGWKNRLRMMADVAYPPATLPLPGWALRAEFWTDAAGDHTANSGAYLYLSTDQVRFYPLDAVGNSPRSDGVPSILEEPGRNASPVPLDKIPTLIFSEVMRDVDLFVGVCSVANDPGWINGGPDGLYRQYWHDFSFGELSASAQTRKTMLQRLMPRLKIADRCSFTGKFLVVRGSLRTYKIHLGSSNILMEPNDQYLCIVPSRTTAAGEKTDQAIFLPFEGDNTLSVILSKAFLLVNDAQIKDPSIKSQLVRK